MPGSDLAPALCGLLAGYRINLAFMTSAWRADGVQVAGCVAATERTRVKALVEGAAALAGRATYTRGVGLLTLYPHRSSLAMFGRSLNALLKSGCRVFAMASSIGALTYVVDYGQIDQAAAILKERFNLAGNHAPFRAEFAVSQSADPCPGGE